MGREAFQYALVRIVPRIERGERFNAGVVVFCRTLRYVSARTALDERRLAVLGPELEPATLQPHLDAIERTAAGLPDAGPIAALPQSERFHWLVAPSSTVIQPSEVHTGLCEQPESALERLFATLVLSSPREPPGEGVAQGA